MAKILLIDDSDLIRRSLQAQLEIDGHEVVAAAHGGEGLKVFQTGRFDIIITDILMPEVEGIETLRRLRQIDQSVPIIAITGGIRLPVSFEHVDMPDYLRMAVIFGATETLRKPFTGRQLRDLIAKCLP